MSPGLAFILAAFLPFAGLWRWSLPGSRAQAPIAKDHLAGTPFRESSLWVVFLIGRIDLEIFIDTLVPSPHYSYKLHSQAMCNQLTKKQRAFKHRLKRSQHLEDENPRNRGAWVYLTAGPSLQKRGDTGARNPPQQRRF